MKTTEATLAGMGKHAIFTPIKTYAPMTVGDLAALGKD